MATKTVTMHRRPHPVMPGLVSPCLNRGFGHVSERSDTEMLGRAAVARPVADRAPASEPLLRQALGSTLRDARQCSGFSLRQLAQLASVSPGYLSELERGRKEVSSEVLASVCHALGVSVAAVIMEAASMMALDVAAAELASQSDLGQQPSGSAPEELPRRAPQVASRTGAIRAR